MSFAHPSEPPDKALRAQITPNVRETIVKLAGAASVNRSHDVKWVGGRSENGQTVYIDKDIPHSMKAGGSYDPARTLPWHEVPEWYLMHEKGLSYQEAHSLATHEFEKPRVEELGLDWRKYQEGWGGEIEHNEKKKHLSPPKDLDKSPYLEGGKISAQEESPMDPLPDVMQTQSQGQAPTPSQDASMGQASDPAMAGVGPSVDEANPQPNLVDQAHSEHQQLASGYKKLTEAKTLLDKVRAGMDSLAALGDMVSHEDVVKEAGKLVAAGLDPSAMASILADMPPEGEALQAWVTQHDQQIAQREQQLEQVQGLVRHEMGTSAMKVLSLAHLKEGLGAHLAGALGPQAPGAAPEGSSPLPSGNALGAPPPGQGGPPPDMSGMDMNAATAGMGG